MKIYKGLEKFFLKCINFFWRLFILIHEYKNIFEKRKIYKDVRLTKEEERQIDEFYKKNYGKKIKYWWHRLYKSYTGNFDYKCVPESIFATKIEPRQVNRLEARSYANKNMLSIIFEDENIKIPKTFIMCVKGRFFDGERNPVSKEKAIEILKNINDGTFEAVAKATVDTNSGKDVKIIDIENGIDKDTRKSLKDIVNSMGDNFVVQEKIIPHKSLANIYEKSINTLRTITYFVDNEIKIAPITFRMGKGGAKVDNGHAGGIFIGMDENGRLLKEAFNLSGQRFSEHPDTGIVFENYQLPCIDKVKEYAIKLHKKIPMLGMVSWDLTVDKDENVVLIEVNLNSQSIWLPQMSYGKSVFGEDTAKMLQDIRKI